MDFDLPEDISALIETTKRMVNDLLSHEPEFQRTNKVPDVVRQSAVKVARSPSVSSVTLFSQWLKASHALLSALVPVSTSGTARRKGSPLPVRS
nr:hypothetical protein [Chachezhania sediminis]